MGVAEPLTSPSLLTPVGGLSSASSGLEVGEADPAAVVLLLLSGTVALAASVAVTRPSVLAGWWERCRVTVVLDSDSEGSVADGAPALPYSCEFLPPDRLRNLSWA